VSHERWGWRGWAFGYNLIALPLAITGLLSPTLAGLSMGLSSVCVIANSLRLRSFGRPRRTAPVRSRNVGAGSYRPAGRSRRLAGIAAAALAPAVILGGLVLARPNTFVGPPSAHRTLAEPNGERLMITADNLMPGTVELHAYLLSGSRSQPSFRTISMRATSDATGSAASVRVRTVGPQHDVGRVELPKAGVWTIRLSGADAERHPLTGTFTLRVS